MGSVFYVSFDFFVELANWRGQSSIPTAGAAACVTGAGGTAAGRSPYRSSVEEPIPRDKLRFCEFLVAAEYRAPAQYSAAIRSQKVNSFTAK